MTSPGTNIAADLKQSLDLLRIVGLNLCLTLLSRLHLLPDQMSTRTLPKKILDFSGGATERH
jgi:hypothetical protein